MVPTSSKSTSRSTATSAAPRGPPFQGSDSAYFVGLNSGKKSLAIDLKTPGWLEHCRALAAIADILIENFRPGTMNRLGLDYASRSATNPRLI